ncbi:thiamine pyrophosphate-dependent enzyme, partial [Candidatus Pelagibacter sp.]|nr:thiamine pyrophosphate-dependent enzyme [Candidatus Pelagibacter sp.]
LSIDAVQKANSGHPGMPMGMADVATVLFKNFLKFNPNNPDWLNRDRFVLSAGHGSMLLYSLLYLTGYKSISLNSIKKFRQLNSICAGHPEYHPKTGIETTTGPLGQGIANAVGFAIAEEILKKKLGKEIINHKTYVLAGDGCLMEGISHEAMSLAGHLKLKNLVMLFDNNSISIDGPTSLAVSDNFKKRFESYGWDYILINGHNEQEIFRALKKVQNAKKPTVISCKTKIGYGSPNKSGKSSSHGSPLGLDEIELARKALNWGYKPFEIPNKILNEWKKFGVDYVFECTGKFNSKEKLLAHINNGAKKVIVSAPCKNADKTIVFGVNEKELTKNDQIISAASCTTNCLAPVANVLHKNFEIEKGFMTTIHAFTSDQRILDNSHKDPRRARSASQSIVPTSTGASKAIGEIIPSLKGKLEGVAMRVPTPNVSLIELVFCTKKEINKEKINDAFKEVSKSQSKKILEITFEKLVSIDFNHNSSSAIVDSSLTSVVGKNMGKISAWYDNEWGFSNRMCDIAEYVHNIS